MLADRIAARAPREAVRSDPVSLEEFGYLLARGSGQAVRSKAGPVVGPQRALGLTAWYSGVRYLAETVASLPVNVYRDVEGSRSERAAPSWMARPDVELPWFQFVELTMMALLHKGNSFSFKLRNPLTEQVVGLREVHPDRVTTGVAPDGTKRFRVDRLEREFTTREILHIPGLAYDGRIGLNPIQALADPLGGIVAADDYSARFFSSGAQMGGIISYPELLTQQQAAEQREVWDQFHAGLLNAHKTGVLTGGARYERISLDAESTQLLESRQFGIAEISRMLRVPPHKLYDLTRATFSNIEHQSIEAVVDGVRPWVERIEAFVNFDADLLPEGSFIEFNLEGLLRGDAAARAAFYTSGINAGWLSPASAARRENEPAPPELDYYLRPLNMAVLREGEPERIGEEVASA